MALAHGESKLPSPRQCPGIFSPQYPKLNTRESENPAATIRTTKSLGPHKVTEAGKM